MSETPAAALAANACRQEYAATSANRQSFRATVEGSVKTLLLDSTRSFTFDHVFGAFSTQTQVFTSVAGMCEAFVDGYNTTVLAYGQTGSGKTFTMGTGLTAAEQGDSEGHGIIPRCIDLMFQLLEKKAETVADFRYTLSVTFLELYNEELIDLLNPLTRTSTRKGSALTIREDASGNVYWAGIKEETVASPQDLLSYLRKGSICRTTGSTDMNLTSSRSHAIFSVILRQELPLEDGGVGAASSDVEIVASSANVQKPCRRLHSKFHFVDLAGSERMKKTKAVGDRAKEGISINSGLLAMGKVIHALNDASSHVPYRDSKLTRLLQDALGGNSQTMMIACVSPADTNFGETLNTLNYASRARNIRNTVVQNQDFQAMEVHQLRAEISRLKMELLTARNQMSLPNRLSQSQSNDSVEWPKKENEALTSEVRRLEVIVYQLQQKNTELRKELTTSRSERDSLMFMQQQKQSSNPDSEPTIHPLIAQYQMTITELENKVDELLQKKEAPSDDGYGKALTSSKSNLTKSFDTLGGSSRRPITSNSERFLSSNPVIAQSPLQKKINQTIEMAKGEIRKERELLERKRANTPTRQDRNRNNYNSSDDDRSPSRNTATTPEPMFGASNNPTSTEDDMLDLLDQITADIKVKEELVSQLQTTQSEYHVMKETYEDKLKGLQEQIMSVQRERDQASHKTDTPEDKDKAALQRSKYEEKLKKLTLEVTEMRRKYTEVQKELQTRRATNENLISSMKVHVESLKKEKIRLIQKMKEKEAVIKEKEAEKEREISMLKRKEKQAGEATKKLEQSNRMTKLMLKKRTEEHAQTQSKLRSVMALLKRHKPNVGSPKSWRLSSSSRRSDTNVTSPELTIKDRRKLSYLEDAEVEESQLKIKAQFKKNILNNELDSFITNQRTNEIMDQLVSRRSDLVNEKSQLEDELANLNSSLDQEKFDSGSGANVDRLMFIQQSAQDAENRLEIIEAEIPYLGARIRSLQLEAAAHSVTGGGSRTLLTAEGVPEQNNFENAVDLVHNLDQDEAKKLLELMLDDLIALKTLTRAQQMEMETNARDKEELQRTVDVLRKASAETAINLQHRKLETDRKGGVGSGEQLDDLESELLQIENMLGGGSISSSTGGAGRHAHQQGKTLLPNKKEALAHSSSNSNVFERLHREQTVASQMKIKDTAVPGAPQTQARSGRASEDASAFLEGHETTMEELGTRRASDFSVGEH